MATKIRLARGGAKKKPYFRVVVTSSRSARDGDFIEKIGTYNPLLGKEDAKRFIIDADRAKYWLGTGAQPSEIVARFLRSAGLLTAAPTFQAKAKGTGTKKKAAA